MAKYAIELVFDEESQKKLNYLRRVLANNGVHDEAVPINHISIADYETDNLDFLIKKVEDFSTKIRPFKLNLSFVGSFMTTENVIFIAPIITNELLKVHKSFLDFMPDLKNNKYYEIDRWQPHCTLAIRLSDNELFKAFKLLKENNMLPIEVTVNRMDILNYPPPYKQEFITNLKGN